MQSSIDFISTLPSKWTLLACSALIYVLVISCYNLFLHPLRKIPGPILSKLTTLWLFRQEIAGDSSSILAELHKQYGPLVRISPNEVSINDREAYVTINRQGTKFTKPKTFYNAFRAFYPNLFNSQDVDFHSRRKRLMSPSFSRASLDHHEVIIYSFIKSVVSGIKDKIRKGEEVSLFPTFRKFALDNICAFTYGFNSTSPVGLDKVSAGKIFEILDKASTIIVFQHFPLLKFLSHHVAAVLPKLTPDSALFLVRYGTERLKASQEASDLDYPGLFKNMQAQLDGKGESLSLPEMIEESSTMFFAGTDTVSTTLGFGIWHLLYNPDAYARLQAEIRTIMPKKDSTPSLRELEKLPFLETCVKESLRIATPPRGRLPRVVPKEGLTVQGTFLPPGTQVSHCLAFLSFNENIFSEPTKFRPDRWLQPDARDLDAYMYPFSRGSRSCID